MKHGIKVTYHDIVMQFTECKYFAFFELLGWDFQFQPHEMEWYLPDFLLRFNDHPHYVEVKGGAGTLNNLKQESQKLFTNSNGFAGGKTLVGTRPDIVLGDPLPLPDGWHDIWHQAVGIADQRRIAKYKDRPPVNFVHEIVPNVSPRSLDRASPKVTVPVERLQPSIFIPQQPKF